MLLSRSRVQPELAAALAGAVLTGDGVVLDFGDEEVTLLGLTLLDLGSIDILL